MSNTPKRITLRLSQGADGTYLIDRLETLLRTKQMIAFDKGLQQNLIRVEQNLEKDLNYSKEEKADLKGDIENVYFSELHVTADIVALKKVGTVGDLRDLIYDKFIPEGNKT